MGGRIDPVQCCTDIVPLIGIVSDSLAHLFRIEQPGDRKMNAKKIKDTLQRLSGEYENLIKWIRKARKVFEQTGADDIAWTGEMKNDNANTDRPTDQLSA